MAPAALGALPARLPRVRDLPARHRTDKDALAERLMHLEACRTLDGIDAVASCHLARSLVGQAVAGIGTDIDGLADDVMRCLAVLADPERMDEREACLGAEVVGVWPGLGWISIWVGDGVRLEWYRIDGELLSHRVIVFGRVPSSDAILGYTPRVLPLDKKPYGYYRQRWRFRPVEV